MKNKIYVFFIAAMLFSFFSCKSTDTKSNKTFYDLVNRTTFMNTGFTVDKKIYSCIAFSEIESVTAIEVESKSKIEIPNDMFSYNSSSTELTISDEFMLPECELSFHIVGLPCAPAKFVLNRIVDEPLVMYNRQTAEKTIDYDFDHETKTVDFIFPLDLDFDSYVIVFFNETGNTQTIGNAMEAYQDYYNREIGKFMMAQLGNATN